MIDFTIDKRRWFEDYDVFKGKVIHADDTMTKDEWLSYVKGIIREGNYAHGFFDEFYIPHKFSYNRRNFEHSFLVYGFDDFEGVFIAIGYTENGKYESYKIPYDNFYEGFYALKKRYGWLAMFHVNEDYDFKFSIDHFYMELSDYLAGDYNGKVKRDVEAYGVRAMEGVIDYLLECVAAGKGFDLRYTRFIAEYRAFTYNKLKFLYEKGYLLTNQAEKYSELVAPAQTVHLLALKYNGTKNSDIVGRIESILRESLKREIEIFTDVKSEIEAIK